jgi:hypothetical protein
LKRKKSTQERVYKLRKNKICAILNKLVPKAIHKITWSRIEILNIQNYFPQLIKYLNFLDELTVGW